MAAAAVQRLGHGALRLTDTQRARASCAAMGLGLSLDADLWARLASPTGGDGVGLRSPDRRAAMETMRTRLVAGLTSHAGVPALPSLTPPPGGDPG